MNLKQSDIKKLTAIYKALCGKASECGTEILDSFYDGGGEKLFSDFEDILKKLGVKFAKSTPGVYFVASYWGFKGKEWAKMGITPKKQWGICTDEHDPNSFVLTGFPCSEDAIAAIKDKSIFDDYAGGKIKVIDNF